MNKKIDIEKYEGHTPPHWIWIDWIGLPETLKDVDKELMQDAPLLLAEVKRLRVSLQIITEDLDSAIAQGHIPITATDGIDVTKIRNFANDASL